MFLFQHFFPVDHPPVQPGDSTLAENLLFHEINTPLVHASWRSIPGTNLEMQLKETHTIMCLSFRKNKIPVYKNVMNLDGELTDIAMSMVNRLYRQYRTDMPATPTASKWIYTIPISQQALLPNDIQFMYEITRLVFNMLCTYLQLQEDRLSGHLPKR
jgi:hypothetical protein